MICEGFEVLIADALGGELSDEDRPAFENHIAVCRHCLDEYQTALAAMHTMQSLPRGDRVSRGVELEVEKIASQAAAAAAGKRPKRRLLASVLRYAASVLIAFTAGYAAHARIAPGPIGAPSVVESRAVHIASGGPPACAPAVQNTLGTALVGAHVKDPGRSDLAKCMIAMFQKRG